MKGVDITLVMNIIPVFLYKHFLFPMENSGVDSRNVKLNILPYKKILMLHNIALCFSLSLGFIISSLFILYNNNISFLSYFNVMLSFPFLLLFYCFIGNLLYILNLKFKVASIIMYFFATAAFYLIIYVLNVSELFSFLYIALFFSSILWYIQLR